MRYIRSCPSCNMELRFPLDMGILIITCPNCKVSFRMDPDDPKTYLSGGFDLTPSKKAYSLPLVGKIVNYLNSPKDIRFLIPVFLFFILILNIIKIFQSTEDVQIKNIENKENDFLQEPDIEQKNPNRIRDSANPSFEI